MGKDLILVEYTDNGGYTTQKVFEAPRYTFLKEGNLVLLDEDKVGRVISSLTPSSDELYFITKLLRQESFCRIVGKLREDIFDYKEKEDE